jgi:acetate---CoA ligase (ADP-forming)
MLGSLRQAPLLKGWRGARPIDLDAAAAALVAIAMAGAKHPEYIELEVNPVLAHPDGAIALDAYGVLAPPRSGTHHSHDTEQPAS